MIGAKMEAAYSIHPLICAIFALDYRVKPYYKYLDWELDSHPLKKFPLSGAELIEMCLKILETGDRQTQIKLFKIAESTFRKNGHGKVFTLWKSHMRAIGI